MSGGSYDYLYSRVDEFIDIMEESPERMTPLREKFRKHLILVSRAMKHIEWVDSGDTSEGDENKAIEAVL